MIYIAHRGNNGNDVENRLEGLLKTSEHSYIDGVEIDIHMTKDGKFVLSHNLLLKENLLEYHAITRYKLKKLKKQKFEIHHKPFPIHTLDEVLKKFPKDKILLVECKTDTVSKEKFAKNLYRCIKRHPLKKLQLCSFDYAFIEYFKKKHPEFICGLIIGYTLNKGKNHQQFDFISLQYRDLHIKGKHKYIWTVNDKNLYKKICKEKVEGIISDKIGLLLGKNTSF